MKCHFLIVDGKDGNDLTARLSESLPEYDLSIFATADPQEGLHHMASNHPAVILFDMCLPAMSGFQFLSEAKKIDHAVSIIMTTSCGNVCDTIETIKHGAFDYFIKPPLPDQFQQVIQKAIDCNFLNRRVRYAPTTGHLDRNGHGEEIMIGSSPKMMEIWKLVGKIVNNDATVLIQGESGTGKELLAKAIYSHSDRNTRPFLAINCAAMPETLLESELFGHEKGAFTDAHQRRIGKFEHCNGGTLLLDEISEMSLISQSKLLRVLENQEFERVGGNDTIKTDVRVIASTNIDLLDAVQQKQFRLDLYHRLKGVNITIPPLRERPEDIPILIDLFCRIFSDRYGKQIKGVSSKAASYLQNSPWNGNIREIKNAIASAVATAQGDILLLEDFLQGASVISETGRSTNGDSDYYAYFVKLLEPVVGTDTPETIGNRYQKVSQDLEKAAIKVALKRSDNNQVLTAKMLGISRNTLRSRIERYRLEQEDGQRGSS
ncbi:MAG: sigma-54-dependent Fis family transcriptional regulator [Geobacteraceae bacterium]|nr:sigma-54-dependent Fis family transcriptional regulator [Geobacteraceae bacterium]